MLRKSPGFTAVAVLTLALGIGANTAILAVMKAVFWPNLPYPHPAQLVDAYNRNLKVSGDYAEMVSIPLLRDWQQRNHSFVDLAATSSSQYLNLSGAGEAARVRTIKVTPNIFSVLELEPTLGRSFREDEGAPGSDHVAVLSYALWKDKFSARSDIIGQTIHLSRESYTVIGVLPENFQLGSFTDRAELLLPLDLVGPDAARRDLRAVFPIGRLKPAVPVAAAKDDLSAITEQLAKTFPSTEGGWAANVISLHDDLVPFGSSQLAIFLGLAGLVLLVACLNIAVLSSAQAETRRQEFAIRAVLGASRARLVRQSVCESSLLSVFGTAGALLFASWGTRLLIRYTPPDFLNNIRTAPLDMPVLAAAAGMCVLTIVLIGLLPAVSSFGTSLNRWLGRGSSRIARSQRGYVFLVGGEIAIGLALVVGAGLLARSLQAISRLDVGFNPQKVVSARVTLDPLVYPSNASRVAFFNRFLAGLQGRSDLSVSAASALPLSDAGWLGNQVSVPGAKSATAPSDPSCSSVFTYPGFFSTIGTPILMGRDFTANESDPVVIVNEAFARAFFPGRNPIGELVLFSPNVNVSYNGASSGIRRIIGVVKDTRDNALRYNAPTFAEAFFSYLQNPVSSLDLVIRSSNSSATVALLRQQAAQLDPSEPLYSVQSMSDAWRQAFGSWRFQTLFGSLAATLALLLSAIGVYGVVSHSVKQRTREIGIRIALGGQPSNIIRAMMKRVSRAIAVGIACGLFAAFALTRHLSSLLFHVAPFDLVSFILGAILLAAIAVLACYIPARRAMKVDPMVALRYE